MSDSNIIYTGDSYGQIIVWEVPDPEMETFGKNIDIVSNIKQKMSGNSGEPIFSLKKHAFSSLLISMSSDDQVSLWEGYTKDQLHEGEQIEPLNRFLYNLEGNDFIETPTALDWIQTNQSQFVVTYGRALICLFDHITGQVAESISVKTNDNLTYVQQQINSISSHPTMSILATGSENGTLSLYDFSCKKEISKTQGAHSDSIGSVLIDPNGINLYTGGHDGKLKMWDIRNFGDKAQCIVEINAHECKGDESIHSIVRHPKLPLVVTSGADQLIKMFETIA